MSQNVLDGVVAIEAKAEKIVEEAKARAKQRRQEVDQQLKELEDTLDREAEDEVGRYKAELEGQKAEALRTLDERLEAASAALQSVQAERLEPLAEEVVRRLEKGPDGD
ncbi:MAG: hypothetical protein ACLF0G_02135 [Candidatus Brocadiia bacterium]